MGQRRGHGLCPLPQGIGASARIQIEQAVLTGSGPTRDGGTLAAGCVSEAECRLLRERLMAFGYRVTLTRTSDEAVALTRRRIEENHPGYGQSGIYHLLQFAGT